MIDGEIKRIIEKRTSGPRVLTGQRDVLETLSGRLLEKEVIEGDELRELMEAGATNGA